MNKPFIIGISGESGVGKSSICEMLSLLYGPENITIISTDDLHKWERNNPAWNSITHLNPEANNLELGDMHLLELSQNKPIYRSVYNHKTGNFNPPKKIEPKSIVIIEGLHAFYSDISQSLIDLKIFVDTNEDLRTHWKVLRDTEERGYKYNDVLDIIEKRRLDNNKIRDKQLSISDIVVEINTANKIMCLGDKHEQFELKVNIKQQKPINHTYIIKFLQEYMTDFNLFVKISENLGHILDICQNAGGNISVKSANDFMMIKASGFAMKDVNRLNGYSVINYKEMQKEDFKNDADLSKALVKYTGKYKRPSMETGMHILLKKCVIHTHAIYITTLLCLENSEEIIKNLFSDFNYDYIKYINPGYGLYDAFKKAKLDKDVFFLENHGIVISDENLKEADTRLHIINSRAKDYIKQQLKEDFKPFDITYAELPTTDNFAFPDAVIFANDFSKKETIAAHNYVNVIGNKLGKIKYLNIDDINVLKGLDSEKYRKTL